MQPKRKLRYPMTQPRFSLLRSLAGALSAVLVAGLLGATTPATAAEPTELARDTFSRTTTSGLGTAEKGGDWISSKAFSVSGGAARVATTPGQIQVAWLSTSSTDIDFVTTASFNRPDSGRLKVGVRGRMVGGGTYDATVLVGATGAPALQLQRTGAAMASAQLTDLDFTSGDQIRIRMQIIGTYNAQLRAKVWETGTPEPAAWQVSAIDSTSSAPTASPVGMWAATDGGTSPEAMPVSFDDVTMATTGAPPPPPPNKAPRASFTMAQKGATVTFDASASTDSDGSIRSYEWDFGDGSKGTGKIVTHTYSGEGQWGIKLTITDDDGAFGRATNGVIYTTSAVFGNTIVSYNSTLRGPGSEQFFGSGADVSYGRAPTLTTGIWLSVSKPGHATPLGIHIQPPSNGKLTVGHFPRVTEFADYTAPGVYLSYDSSGLSFLGDLEIRELTADSTGKLTSFDVVFGGTDVQWSMPIWGQVRANQAETSRYVLGARAFSFPSAPVGAKPMFATQWIRNTSSSALPVGRAALTGGSAADYVLADDQCSGRTLAAGARCSVRVGYAPRAAGIRNGTLSIPIDGATQPIELSGWAPAGTSKITVSSEDLGQPGGTTYANGSHRVWAQRVSTSTRFDAVPQGSEDYANVHIRHGQDDRLRLGRHPITTDPMDRNGHHLHIGVGSKGCQAWKGSFYTVHSLRQTTDGVPTMVDLSFTVYCLGGNGKATTGRVQYNLRSDLTAPVRPSSLRISGTGASRSASWTRSTSGDQAYTVVRLVPGTGTNGSGTSGYAVYSGTGTSAVLPAMKKGQRYTLHVFSVDKTGNVSAPATLAVTG